MLTIYQRRLRSNLRHALRPMWGAQTEEMAERMAALIDGAYLRQSLGLGVQDSEQAVKLVMGCLPIKESMNG